MDLPLFSQIPSAVLKKVKFTSAEFCKQPKKSVKFNTKLVNEPISEELSTEVTSSLDTLEQHESQEVENEKPKVEKPENTIRFASPKTIKSPRQLSTEKVDSGTVYTPISPPISPFKKRFSDAIIQTDVIKPSVVSVKTQTIESFMRNPFGSYNEHINQVKADSLGCYKPMYSIPKAANGQQPPLKIGLVLPRGKKRKVFYPDEQEEEQLQIEYKPDDDNDDDDDDKDIIVT